MEIRHRLFTVLPVALCCALQVKGQLVINTVNTPCVQTFDALAASGSSNPQAGGIFNEGWSFLESGSSASNNQQYAAGNGSLATGDTYSFGIAGTNPVTDRALGILQTGTLSSVPGFKFFNNTNKTVASLLVGFTVEVWRLSAGTDHLTFSYQIGDVALDAPAGWISVPELGFTTPQSGSGQVDGNNAAQRTAIAPVLLCGLYIPQGATVTFRWVDNSGASSAAMAIDDFSISLIPASTAQFRSAGNGNWNTPGIWEKSTDGGLSWLPAFDLVPNNLAAGVQIRTGHTVAVSADLFISKLTVQAGATLLWTAGNFSLTDSPGDDLVLQGVGSRFEIAAVGSPSLASNASVQVADKATILLSGNNNVTAYHGSSFTYYGASVFEYSNPGAPLLSGILFDGQAEAAMPVFRYNAAGVPLANAGALTIKGKLEVASGGLNLAGITGPITFRDGLIGDGQLTAALVTITGTDAEIGGAGNINSHLTIAAGSLAGLSSNKTVSPGKTILVNGTMDMKAWQWQTVSGTASFTVSAAGTVKTANPGGFLSLSGSLKTGSFSVGLNAGATVDYNADLPQVVTVSPAVPYQHLRISGLGVKTVQSGANLVVQGSCVVQSGSSLSLSGNTGDNLFLNNNASLQVAGGGTFDNGGESQVTSSSGTPAITIGGRFITRDQQGLSGTGAAIPSITPVFSPNSTVEYGRVGDQTIQAALTYEHLHLSGSGVKTPTNALSLNGTVTISDAAILNGSANTIGGPTNNLVMTGTSRLVVGGTGTRPAIGGTYTLSPASTIEFSNNNATTATIRQGNPTLYANLLISGNNVTAPLSGISMQAGGTFTVTTGGILKLSSPNGLLAAANAAILSANNPAIVLQAGSVIEYNGAGQQLTTGITYSGLVLSGTGSKTAAAPYNISETLTRSGSAVVAGESPSFLPGATLVYADATSGRTYTTGPEWPSANAPTGVTVNLTGGSNARLVLSEDKQVTGTLNLQAGILDLNDKTVQFNGPVTGSGTITGSKAASLILDGGTANLRFTQTTDTVTNALANLQVKSGQVTLGSRLNLFNSLELTGGTLDLAGQPLVLKSNFSQTARVGEIKGVLVGDGSVTVERYIPAWSSRRYRLASVPVAGLSINGAWQGGLVYNGSQHLQTGTATVAGPTPNVGTMITGQQMGTAAAANALGFDFWPEISNSSASVRRYLPGATDAQGFWQSLPNTTTAVGGLDAYLLFVRGDRTVTTAVYGPASITVLRPKGPLRKGAFSTTIPAGVSRVVVGNPYASPLDFQSVYTDNAAVIQNQFWIWQAGFGTGTGGYVLVRPTSGGVYETVPSLASAGPSTANRLIHSGEGFFVLPAGGGTLSVQESHKAAGQPTVSAFRQLGTEPWKLYVNAFAESSGQRTLVDGALAQFEEGFAGPSAGNNVQKAVNTGENLSIRKGGQDLIVASSALPSAGDTVQLRLWNTTARNYQLEVSSKNAGDAQARGLQAFLWDRHLQKSTPLALSSTTPYPFSITAEEGTRDPLRFAVVFRLAPLPENLTTLRATPVPGGGVRVAWSLLYEGPVLRYEVERSASATAGFAPLAQVAARGSLGEQHYQHLDDRPLPVGYYRVKLVGRTGEVRYSSIVSVELPGLLTKDGYGLYPNLWTGGPLRLLLKEKAAGTYKLLLFNTAGQQVWQTSLEHPGATALYPLELPQRLASGTYHLRLQGSPPQKPVTLPLSIAR